MNGGLKLRRIHVDEALATCPKRISQCSRAHYHIILLNKKPCLCCRNVLTSETLSLGCVENNRRELYAVGVLCALCVSSPLLRFHVSPVHAHTASGFRGRTLLAVDQPDANSIQVSEGGFESMLMPSGRAMFHTARVDSSTDYRRELDAEQSILH